MKKSALACMQRPIFHLDYPVGISIDISMFRTPYKKAPENFAEAVKLWERGIISFDEALEKNRA